MPADVKIRFSVENEEVVRKALEALGPAGDKALRQLNAAAQQPGRGLSALSSVMDELKGRATGLAFSVGPLGTGLIALGPAGLAAGAVIGALATAFAAAAGKADELADRAKRLKEASETTGTTIRQFQLLTTGGARVGLDADTTARFIERLTAAVEDAKRGGGALFDELLRIDSALLRQVVSARDTAAGVELLARAYTQLGDAGTKAKLVAAIGGKGSAERGQLLDLVAGEGGIEGLQKFGRVVDTEIVERMAKARTEIEKIRRETSDAFWGPSEQVLAAQKLYAESWLSIVRSMFAARSAAPGGVGGPDDWMMPPHLRQPAAPGAAPAPAGATVPPGGALSGAIAGAMAAAQGGTGATPLAAELELVRRRNAVLGEAIMPLEQLRQKELEVAAAIGVTNEQRDRAIAAMKLSQERAEVAARVQLGLASEEEMIAKGLRELQDLRAKDFIKDDEEMAAAERLMLKAVKETSDQLRVRNSLTPQLTKLSIDADKLRENLDEGLAGALRGSTSSFIEFAKGAKTAGQAVSDMSTRLLEAVANAMLMKSVVGPLSSGLSGLLAGLFGGGGGPMEAIGNPLPSAFGNAFASGKIAAFARGGIVHRPTFFPMAHGAGLMGEAGPEAVMPLRRLGSGRLGVDASGAAAPISVTIINNTPSRVTTREESDGRGGRKLVTQIDEMVATAISRPGGRTAQALRHFGGFTKR